MTVFCVLYIQYQSISISSLICQKLAAEQLPTRASGTGLQGKVAWTVHYNTNLTRLGHSPPAGLWRFSVMGHLSSLRPLWPRARGVCQICRIILPWSRSNTKLVQRHLWVSSQETLQLAALSYRRPLQTTVVHFYLFKWFLSAMSVYCCSSESGCRFINVTVTVGLQSSGCPKHLQWLSQRRSLQMTFLVDGKWQPVLDVPYSHLQ